MEASLFTLEMDDWPLFGGQLLTVPDTPSLADLNGHVLQDWSHEPAGQLVSTSPSVEVLQDSIWPDISHGDESTEYVGFWRKENHLIRDFNPSPAENYQFSFSNNVLGDVAMDDFSSAWNGGHDLYNDSQDSPIDVKFEYGNVSSNQAALGLSDNSSSNDQILFKTLSATSSSSEVPITIDLHAFDNNHLIDSVPQEVPDRFYSDLDSFDCDSDSLRDPENVYKILQQLADSGNSDSLDAMMRRPILSPVSSEEVESVLSRASPACSEGLQILTDAHSPAATPVFETVDSSAVLMQEYLQHDFTPKSDLSFSRASTPAEPYCVELKPDRRLKKKEQNKTAALRYRRKKREEKGVVLTEVEELELKNSELKARAGDLTREINYLRGLLDEIKKQ